MPLYRWYRPMSRKWSSPSPQLTPSTPEQSKQQMNPIIPQKAEEKATPFIPEQPEEETIGARRITRLYLPEDIADYEVDVNPCTGTIKCGLLDPPFSFHRYIKFQQLQVLQLILNQRNEEKETKSEISDEQLKQKFTEHYGPVNFDNPWGSKLLDLMRNTMLELCSDNQKIQDELANLGIYPDPKLSYAQQLEKFIERQRKSKPWLKYNQLNPFLSEGDWLSLPRTDYGLLMTNLSPSEVDLQDIFNDKIKWLKNHNIIENSPPYLLQNLVVFDPKVELCLKPPYSIERQDNEKNEEWKDITIPKMLSCRMIQFLNEYPLGISPAIFAHKFFERYGYPLDDNDKSLQFMFEAHKNEINFIKLDDKIELIFPVAMEGVLDLQIMLKRYWHHVRSILENTTFMELKDVMAVLNKEYEFKVDPELWGFCSLSSWFDYLIEKFNCQVGVVVEQVSYVDMVEGKEVLIHKYFLMLNSDMLKKYLCRHFRCNDLKNLPENRKVDCLEKGNDYVPEGFMHQFSNIHARSNMISAGSKRVCYLYVMNNPEAIGLFLEKDIRKRKSFQTSLQEDLRPLFDHESLIPKSDCLKPGMYVMANIKWSRLPLQWYRARIVYWDSDSKKYLVYGIDTGFLREVALGMIRYMPKDKVGERTALCVPTQLFNVKHPYGKDKLWDPTAANKAIDELTGKYGDEYTLRVEFKRSAYDPVFGCRKWSISCDAVDYNKEHRKYQTTNQKIEEKFVKLYKKHLID